MRFLFVVPVLAAAIPRLFLAAHHTGSPALGADELPLFVRRVGHFPHLHFTLPAKHIISSFRPAQFGVFVRYLSISGALFQKLHEVKIIPVRVIK